MSTVLKSIQKKKKKRISLKKINSVKKSGLRLSCDAKIEKSFFKFINKIRKTNKNVGITTLNNTEYILKKIRNDSVGREDIFYKKFSKKILKDEMDKYVQIPLIKKNCISEKKKYYLFTLLGGDITTPFLRKLPTSDFNNILKQCLMVLYYLNYGLKVYHGDIYVPSKFFELNNFMYVKNTDKNLVLNVSGGLKEKVGKYRVVVIDLEHFSSKKNNRILYFYKVFKKLLKIEFKYQTEVFILFALLYIYKKGTIDIRLIKNTYSYFYNKLIQSNSTKKHTDKDFDKIVIKHCCDKFF